MRLTDRWNAFEPDVVITSDAVRCSETLACMGEAREAFGAPVAARRDVYDDAHGDEGVVDAEACVETIGRRVVRHANENGARCVLCLGHNMGFEVAARYLTGRAAPLKTAHARCSRRAALVRASIGRISCSRWVKTTSLGPLARRTRG